MSDNKEPERRVHTGDLLKKVVDLETSLSRAKANISDMSKRLSHVEAEQATMKKDQTGMAVTLDAIRDDTKSLRELADTWRSAVLVFRITKAGFRMIGAVIVTAGALMTAWYFYTQLVP